MSTTEQPAREQATAVQELARQHRQMAILLDWLASLFTEILTSPLPEGSMAGPDGWSYAISGYRTFVAVRVNAPSPEQAKMLAPPQELPPNVPCGPAQVVFLVPRAG